VDSHKIVVHEMNCHHRRMVFELLGKTIRQARKATHPHPHREVLAFDVAGADVPVVRISAHYFHAAPDALRRGIPGRVLWGSAVDLLKLRVIAIHSKCTLDRFEVSLKAVALVYCNGQLSDVFWLQIDIFWRAVTAPENAGAVKGF
jgi:hypothetical protein